VAAIFELPAIMTVITQRQHKNFLLGTIIKVI